MYRVLAGNGQAHREKVKFERISVQGTTERRQPVTYGQGGEFQLHILELSCGQSNSLSEVLTKSGGTSSRDRMATFCVYGQGSFSHGRIMEGG